MFFWNSLAFSMIQRILAIWPLVPLPFLNPAWTSGSSRFTYCWNLAWRVFSIILLACEMSAIVRYFEHYLALPFFRITFFFPIIRWIIAKVREFQKTSISALLTMSKPLTVWITINCEKFWKRWEYQNKWPASWETCMQVRKQQLELDMEQQTGSK